MIFSLHATFTDVDAPPDNISTLYDLIANVTHESVAGTTRDKENTVWKAHLRAAGGGGDNEKWFMIQDLIVEETRKEMIFLGETIIQVIIFFVAFQINLKPSVYRYGNAGKKLSDLNCEARYDRALVIHIQVKRRVQGNARQPGSLTVFNTAHSHTLISSVVTERNPCLWDVLDSFGRRSRLAESDHEFYINVVH